MGPTPSGPFPHPPPPPQGQHYEEEKRALSHEIVALNSHLLEAKVTIDKLSEDNVSVAPVTRGASRLRGLARARWEDGAASPEIRCRGHLGGLCWKETARACSLGTPAPAGPGGAQGRVAALLPRAHETGPAARHAPDG